MNLSQVRPWIGAGLLLSISLASTGGCQKQTAVPDQVNVPAPVVVAVEAPQLKVYSEKLAPISADRDRATVAWRQALRDAEPELVKVGPIALVPATEKYKQALDKAEKELKALKPPQDAKLVHDALLHLFTNLRTNVTMTLAAMHSDGAEDSTQLSDQRKQIEANSAEELKEAFFVCGYDMKVYREKGIIQKIPPGG